MMSWDWGLRDMGNSFLWSSGSLSQNVLYRDDPEESIQVSKTSVHPTSLPPHTGHLSTGGASRVGSQ